MIDLSLADRLEALLPPLRDGRQTHVEWGEWMRGDVNGSRAAQNPGVGTAEFHDGMVAEYDSRIQTVTDAATAIRAEYAAS